MKRRRYRIVLGAALALGYCVLALYQGSQAAAPGSQPPFPNAAEQRLSLEAQMKETNDLLRQQNALLAEQLALLRSGQIRVVVTLPEGTK